MYQSVARLSFFAVLILLASAVPAGAARIVFLAEQEFAYVDELYLVDLSAPGSTTRLNRPLSCISNGVSSFAVSPDGAQIAFSADQTTVGDADLFLVDITAPGRWTRIGALAAGQQELRAKFSPDGRKLAFTASDQFFGDVQLYVVDLADPANAVRLNSDLVEHGAVSHTGFEFTPDGTRIVYVAAELESKFELYMVDVAAPRQSTRLNAPGGNVGDHYEGRFHILPDSERVVYSAVGGNPGVRELHMVSLDEPGQPVTLNAPLQSDGDIFEFTVSPDGRFVAYAADQDVDHRLEVFLVDVAVPGVATRFNGNVQLGAALARFTPDSKHIVYSSDEERGPGERDLFIVSVEQPAHRVRLNAPVAAGVDIGAYAISADGAQVAYQPTPAGGFPVDLMVVDIASPGTAVKVNGPLPNGALEFQGPRFSPDGEAIAYIAVESVDESIQELFFARVSEPGTSVRLNAALPPEGIVAPFRDSFDFLPANAPPTGSAPPSVSPPCVHGEQPGAGGEQFGGGGAVGLPLLLSNLVTLNGRRRRASCVTSGSHRNWNRALSLYARLILRANGPVQSCRR